MNNISVKNKPYQILSREWLKIFAIIFMVFDHAYMTVVNVPGHLWMTMLGRLAFPIFAFQVSEGFIHTHNKKRYIINMLIFALISEIPYNLMMGATIFNIFHQNVMFTFLEALLFLDIIEKVIKSSKKIIIKIILIALLCLASGIIGTITLVDYMGAGVLTVIMFYLTSLIPNNSLKMLSQLAGLWYINFVILSGQVIILNNGWELPIQGLAILSLVFIFLYNGKKTLSGTPDKIFKYFSYVFYPAHILILSAISLIQPR